MKVLGVSGSPIPDSNTDRALKEALEATGLETEFIKLKDYNVEPCNACLGCVKTNQCVQKDDGVLLAEKTKEADALIIGSYTPYANIDARSKAFLERLYPLRHNHGFMGGKPGGAIVASCILEGSEMLPPAADMAVNSIKFFMMEENMNFLGEVKVLGNVPCIKCGRGDECKMSAIKMLNGPDATVESVGTNVFEKQPDAINSAKELGLRIKAALAS